MDLKLSRRSAVCGRTAPDRRNPSRGFTVLELLVCLGIIGVLLSLLIPAISRAHRSARRAQCQNNLKQLNLALGMYHDLHETFPPGYVSRDVRPDDAAPAETGSGFAWGSMILGLLEQGAMASGIDFHVDATDPANFGLASSFITTFLCPTAMAGPAFEVELDWGPFLLGTSSYVGMYGFGSLAEQPGAPPGPGILYRNSYVPISKVRDGCSNTILLGERVGRYITSPDRAPIDAEATWVAAVPGAFRPAGLADHPDYWEGPASLVLGTAGQDAPFPVQVRPNVDTYIGGFSSHHGGGFHAGMADTSVRFLYDGIDFTTFRRLAQRDDREPIGDF
ncbi:MAG: DUF1559 domain-containing protein [Planctomycetaceae bacterium]|nr:DUF1559 domain-containing protein [Planctomycetaceae bacterium]